MIKKHLEMHSLLYTSSAHLIVHLRVFSLFDKRTTKGEAMDQRRVYLRKSSIYVEGLAIFLIFNVIFRPFFTHLFIYYYSYLFFLIFYRN